MKVEKSLNTFRPVTITFETEEELKEILVFLHCKVTIALPALLFHKLRDTIQDYSPADDFERISRYTSKLKVY